MVSLDFFLILLFFVNITIIHVVKDIRTEDIILDEILPFGKFQGSGFFFTINVDVIDTTHENKELFEIQTSKLDIIFHFGENDFQDSHSQLLAGSLGILGGLLQFPPV